VDTRPGSQRLTNWQDTWSARCGENRTAGAAGGPGKPTRSDPDKAPRSDPATALSLLARAWGTPGARLGWLRAHREDIVISLISAWPRGRGHGGRLMDAMAPGLTGDGRRVVAAALTTALARTYRRRAERYPDAVFVLAGDQIGDVRAPSSS
jgi:hypothetical protein